MRVIRDQPLPALGRNGLMQCLLNTVADGTT